MKKNIHTAASLSRAISDLNTKADHLLLSIKKNFTSVSNHLKPANLIKSGALVVFSNKNKIIDTGIGLLAGLVSRRFIVGSSGSLLGKTMGKILQLGITLLVSKNADKVRGKAGEIIDKLKNKEKRSANYSIL